MCGRVLSRVLMLVLVQRTEYGLVLVTFVAINLVGLESGMLIGIGVAALSFVLQYAPDRPSTSYQDCHMLSSVSSSRGP